MSGTASRSDYWWPFLTNLIIGFLLQNLQNIRAIDYGSHPTARIGTGDPKLTHWLFSGGPNSVVANFFGIIFIVFLLATLIPKFTVAIRRSHDIGWSGWWVIAIWGARTLLLLIGITSAIILMRNSDNMSTILVPVYVMLASFLMYPILSILEMTLLAQRSNRPNRFTEEANKENEIADGK